MLVYYETCAQGFKLNDLAYLDQGANPFTPANGFFPLGTNNASSPFDVSCTVSGAWLYAYYSTNGGITNLYLPTYGGTNSQNICTGNLNTNVNVCWSAFSSGVSVYGGQLLQFLLVGCVNGIAVVGAGESVYTGFYTTNSSLSSTYSVPVFEQVGSAGTILIVSNVFSSSPPYWIIISNAAPVSLSFARTIYAITNSPVIPAYGATFNSTTNGLNGFAALPTPTVIFYITNHP